MPFAKNSGSVTRSPEPFSNRDFVAVHFRAATRIVNDAGAIMVTAGHQAGARRRADRAHIEARKLYAFLRETIQVRRTKMRIVVHPNIAVALVVGHHHDDIGARFSSEDNQNAGQARAERGEESKTDAHARPTMVRRTNDARTRRLTPPLPTLPGCAVYRRHSRARPQYSN